MDDQPDTDGDTAPPDTVPDEWQSFDLTSRLRLPEPQPADADVPPTGDPDEGDG
jgi:hypothetical protein